MFKASKLSATKSYHLKKNTFKWIINIVKFFFIAGMCYLFLFPVIYLLTAALQDPATASDPTIIYVPTQLSLENFKLAIEKMDFWSSAGITLLITVLCTGVTLLSCSMVGYGFARYKFFENKIAFMLVIILIIIPPQTTTIPTFINFRFFDPVGIVSMLHGWFPEVIKEPYLQLTGSAWSMVIPAIFASGIKAGLCIYIFRQFFLGQPKELEEAAKIDGCSAFGTYFRVMLPLATPAIITVAVLSSVWYWTDSFYSSIFFDPVSDKSPLSATLSILYTSATSNTGVSVVDPEQIKGLLAAAAFLTIIPILIAYLIVQRKFTESIERTGIVG
ncbi:MAG: carbohydrate ABC transporter permease [Clostridia bacterium]|nr:carbohydrate ABC transporter permease [Clostridia bacterium]